MATEQIVFHHGASKERSQGTDVFFFPTGWICHHFIQVKYRWTFLTAAMYVLQGVDPESQKQCPSILTADGSVAQAERKPV